MTRYCVTIDVDGEPVRAHFDRDPTDEDLAAVAAIARSVRRHFNELPTEVIAAEEWYRRALAQHRKDHAP